MIRKNFLFTVFAVLFLCTACENSDDRQQPESETGKWCGTIAEYTLTTDALIDLISQAVPDLKEYPEIISGLICDIDIAKIKYTTEAPDGNIIEASGMIIYPSDMQEYGHILSIQHGTQDINGGPTDQVFPIEAAPVFCHEAVVMADLLGYGISKTDDLWHTYIHTKSTGTACADMIQAARQYLKDKNMRCTSDSIRLIGYSQGGHATMATLFELQRRHMEDQISLVWAGAGPYDLDDYLKNTIASPTGRKLGYLVYSLEGITNGDRLDINRRKLYAPEMFENGKDSLFTKCYISQWPELLGDDIYKVLNADWFKPDYGGNEDIKTIMDAAHRNSIVKLDESLSNNIHICFYHLKKDTYVPYSCSESAASKSEWSENCELVDLTLANDHPAAGFEFLIEYMGSQNEIYYLLEFIIPYLNEVIN